jgi:hypothetical protein
MKSPYIEAVKEALKPIYKKPKSIYDSKPVDLFNLGEPEPDPEPDLVVKKFSKERVAVLQGREREKLLLKARKYIKIKNKHPSQKRALDLIPKDIVREARRLNSGKVSDQEREDKAVMYFFRDVLEIGLEAAKVKWGVKNGN